MYRTEAEAGSMNEGKYPDDIEVGCAVCSVIKRFEGAVYTRWGATECPAEATKLYAGTMAGQWWDYSGGAVNYLCMHPDSQEPEGASSGNNNGNLLCTRRSP